MSSDNHADLQEVRTKIGVLVERVSNLTKIAEKMSVKVDRLPCDEYRGVHNSHAKQLSILWLLVSGIVLALIGAWVR